MRREGDENGGTVHKIPFLPKFRASQLAKETPRPRLYLDGHGLFLANRLNVLSGAGAIGKSLVMLQLAAAVALPEDIYPQAHWLGRPIRQRGPVLYVTTEDDRDEVHRRLIDIAAADYFDIAHLSRLEIAELCDREQRALFVGGRQAIRETPVYQELEFTMVYARQPYAAIILDNRAQLADVDELNRSAATKIGGALDILARRHGSTIILLTHPSLAGIAARTGASGSTGWFNGIRNQVDMRKPADDEPSAQDDGKRELAPLKANYGPMGRVVNVLWELGCYRCTDKPERAGADIGKADRAERVFLALLNLHNERGDFVSARTKARNYAPKVFAAHPKREGLTPRLFAAAMESLFEKGAIRSVRYGPPSDDTWKLEVEKCNF
ncbi:AAA family ATPase [Sinorhizobium meliloti]|uniref:AAA family ATPase n=1 Tax=Rhizobium meliloti TaxID=382 RepID=UPI000FD47C6B|nr:AAA family ATPase [Sinorhizobium meliloti]RVP80659.1 AAA family ATPase [Sinorhizobium meliloti]